MKTSEYIVSKINRMPASYVFTYTDFINKVNGKEAVIKTLNRMAASGKIRKLAKGKFYKSKTSIFGDLPPNQYQVVKDLLEDKGKRTGYITGYSIYNRLALTTQISNTIIIGKNETRPSLKREQYKIAFIKQKNPITKENIPLLQILDAIRFIKKIPDTNNATACKRFLSIIKDLKKKDKIMMIRLAQKYPPATRALLGALLEEIGSGSLNKPLKQSLNPITVYKLSGVPEVLPTAQKWNIR